MTRSVCPICLKPISARRVKDADGAVYLEKECKEHGKFRDIIWRGLSDFDSWCSEEAETNQDTSCSSCPGLSACGMHERDTCCTLLEVTSRCNMHCRFCFAGDSREEDPSLEEIRQRIDQLVVPGETFLQLSGGEPTVREDLAEIIRYAKSAGCTYVQLNSNGIRLAQEEGYASSLAEAGLSFVFLQFDGLTELPYRYLRRRDMFTLKEKAIDQCGRAGLGVTLVPVIVPGVNENEIGQIIRFAAEHSPVVRGVHFQPVSYFGRIPASPGPGQRYTLDQLVSAIYEQTRDLVPQGSIIPSRCDHPLCGLHGGYIVLPDGSLLAVTSRPERSQTGSRQTESSRPERGECSRKDPAASNRRFIGDRWKRNPALESAGSPGGESEDKTLDMTDLLTFARRAKSHSFTITAMCFQDAGNYDFERLRSCSLHVFRDGVKMPFCAAYLTAWPEEEARCIHPGDLRLTDRLWDLCEKYSRMEESPLPAMDPGTNDKCLLDIGCGHGLSIRHLKDKHPDWIMKGIDPLPPEGEEFMTGCGEALPWPDKSLNRILMECSLNHTDDPLKVLEEAHRVLVPGGMILISDLYLKETGTAAKSRWLGEGKQAEGLSRSYIKRIPTAKEMRNRLEGAGFHIIDMVDCPQALGDYAAQAIMDGRGSSLCRDLGLSMEAFKELKIGYFICVAERSILPELLSYVTKKSPAYGRKLAASFVNTAGIPAVIKESAGVFERITASSDDLRVNDKQLPPGEKDILKMLPLMSSDEIKEAPEEYLTASPRDIARIITLHSSGSMDKPKRIFFTHPDMMRTADFFEWGIRYLVDEGDRVGVFMEGPSLYSIGGQLTEAISRLPAETHVFGLIKDMSQAAKEAEDMTTLIGVTSQIAELAEYAPYLRPKTVLLSAEYVPESAINRIESIWHTKVYTHWGMSETGYGGGVQCGARQGYHLRHADLILEIIDPVSGEVLPEGEEGEIVITTIHRLGMPLIRYRTGDLGSIEGGICPCGSLMPRLSKVKGRITDSILTSAGVRLCLPDLDEILYALPGLLAYQADWNRKNETLHIGLDSNADRSENLLELARQALENHYDHKLRITVDTCFAPQITGSAKRRIHED